MSYKTAMGRVIGLGSAHHGGAHWLSERLSAVVMIPLTLGALFIFAPLFGETLDVVLASLSRPVNAMVLIAFFIVCAKHLADGLQVVIEDYVHAKGWFIVLLLISRFGSWGLGFIGVFSIAKIAFGG